jgi:predicted RNA-binding protein YlxR (DUF448 family)
MSTTKKKNKVILRRCIATGEALHKDDLLRIVRTPEGIITLDPSGKMNGRGAYVKKDSTVVAILKKNNGLNRALKSEIDPEFYDLLLKAISDGR